VVLSIRADESAIASEQEQFKKKRTSGIGIEAAKGGAHLAGRRKRRGSEQRKKSSIMPEVETESRKKCSRRRRHSAPPSMAKKVRKCLSGTPSLLVLIWG